jgi:hypothetical protein
MSETKSFWGNINWGLRLPLFGILMFWYLFIVSIYSEQVLTVSTWTNSSTGPQPRDYVHPMIYLNLLGIAILVVTSLLGRRLAAAQLAINPNLRLNRNTYALTTVAVITALIGAGILAIAIFLGNISFGNDGNRDPVVRILSLYVPIVLDAAVILFGILRAFVVKPKVEKNV